MTSRRRTRVRRVVSEVGDAFSTGPVAVAARRFVLDIRAEVKARRLARAKRIQHLGQRADRWRRELEEDARRSR